MPYANRSAHGAFEGDAEQLAGFGGELHGQFLEHVLGIAVDDEAHGLLGGNAALVAVEQLVLGDLAGGGLVLEDGGGVLHVDVGEGVGAAVAAQEQRVARGVVACVLGGGGSAHQSAVAVL